MKATMNAMTNATTAKATLIATPTHAISRITLMAFLALSLGLVACSESSELDAGDDGGMEDGDPTDTGNDGDIVFDTDPPDVPTPPPMGVCGNGMQEAGETCDDGNTESGDGCSATCSRESFCGDGDVGAGEICDDGNNASGDGCRSDCASDESCGNGIRDVATGEVCDGGDNCSADCRTLMSCGNDSVDSGESCDDGNTDSWDGCGPDCQEEISVIIDDLELLTNDGCDFSGDGNPDNQLGAALGVAAALIGMNLSASDLNVMMSFVDLDDVSGANDDAVSIAWLQGEDADGDASNNFSGMGQFLVNPSSLRPDGSSVASFVGGITMNNLRAGPEDIQIPTGFFPLDLRQTRILGTTTSTAGELSAVTDGRLCGAVPVQTFGRLPNFIDMVTGGPPPPPCDESGVSTSLADVLVGGATVFGLTIGGQQPDVDLDGDGIESYEVDSDGPPGCQPVITACINGDGLRLEGRDCVLDLEFADGYSTAIDFSAVRVEIVGVSP